MKFDNWRTHPADLGPYGIASHLEYRSDHRHGVSHLMMPNGTLVASEHAPFCAVVGRLVIDAHREAA